MPILFSVRVFEQEKHLSSHMLWELALESCNQKSPFSNSCGLSVAFPVIPTLPTPAAMKEKVQGFWSEIDVTHQILAIMAKTCLVFCLAASWFPPGFPWMLLKVLAQGQSPMKQFLTVCNVQ